MRGRVLIVTSWLCAVTSVSGAQDNRFIEMRPLVGVAVPTGAQRNVMKAAVLYGLQGAVTLYPALDVVATFSWRDTKTKYNVSPSTAHVMVFDVGLEHSLRGGDRKLGELIPFLGGGVGGRAYDFRSRTLSSETCFAGYASAGAHYDFRASSVRLAARDDLLCYRSPVDQRVTSTQNEVSLTFGIGVRF